MQKKTSAECNAMPFLLGNLSYLLLFQTGKDYQNVTASHAGGEEFRLPRSDPIEEGLSWRRSRVHFFETRSNWQVDGRSDRSPTIVAKGKRPVPDMPMVLLVSLVYFFRHQGIFSGTSSSQKLILFFDTIVSDTDKKLIQFSASRKISQTASFSFISFQGIFALASFCSALRMDLVPHYLQAAAVRRAVPSWTNSELSCLQSVIGQIQCPSKGA